MGDREALSIPEFDDDLDDFAPRKAAPKPTPKKSGAGQGGKARKPAAPTASSRAARRTVDAVSHFPSREAASDGQLNLKGPQHVLDRFKAMCKADRRAYYDMLEILMDSFEGAGQEGG
ncbi:hypothetical protein [Mameliella alba]|uniref:hypothetical protein n=1 Tax=Mameliella alba TaxID=561184 RepID=UPI000B529EB5|nr:hypothetical protein [Mameliella alba]OWV39212.1 hypothetical protein CDZ95_27225 [Mameliella alba]